jgi:hypothetical protein
MALFLDGHELEERNADEFLAAWSDRAATDVRCLKRWVGEDRRNVALLVEAPDEDSVRICDPDAKEVTELFAPAKRWLSLDSIEMA